jgi:HPt (histidine-containing phosphotransfer) domain-containing protein
MIKSLLDGIPQMIPTSVYDDLEQLSYVLMYLIYDSYPWMFHVQMKSKEKKFQFSQEAYQVLIDEREAFINNLDNGLAEKQFVLCLRETLEKNQSPNYLALQEIIWNL